MSGVYLNWRRHSVGEAQPCVSCGHPALMRNEAGQPQHKTCAQEQIGRLSAAYGTRGQP